MMLQQFQVLAAYQRQMNQQFYTVCEQLGEEELRQDRGAYFKSIFGTLNHMLLTDRLWLSGFLGNPISFSSLFEELYDNRKNQIEDRNLAANPKFKPQVDEYRRLLVAGWKKALPPGVENSSELPIGDDSWYDRSLK